MLPTQLFHSCNIRGRHRFNVMLHRYRHRTVPHKGLNYSVLNAGFVEPRSEAAAQRVPSVPLNAAVLQRCLDCRSEIRHVERLTAVGTLEDPDRAWIGCAMSVLSGSSTSRSLSVRPIRTPYSETKTQGKRPLRRRPRKPIS
jgi:hypothetical protein